jgi:hypothetical protein
MGERRMRWAPLLVVLALAGCAPAPGIPDGQAASELLVAALAEASADAELVSVPGGEHALGVLDDDLRGRIASWLRERLA